MSFETNGSFKPPIRPEVPKKPAPPQPNPADTSFSTAEVQQVLREADQNPIIFKSPSNDSPVTQTTEVNYNELQAYQNKLYLQVNQLDSLNANAVINKKLKIVNELITNYDFISKNDSRKSETISGQDINSIARRDGNADNVTLSEFRGQGIIPQPPQPPQIPEFKFAFTDVQKLFEVADLGGRSRDGALKKDELETFLATNKTSNSLYPLAKVLLDNFDALKQVIDKPASLFSPSGEFISLDNLKTIAGRDGNATIFSSADLKAINPPPPPPLPPENFFSFLTPLVIQVIKEADSLSKKIDVSKGYLPNNGAAGLGELQDYLASVGEKSEKGQVAKALIDNFSSIINDGRPILLDQAQTAVFLPPEIKTDKILEIAKRDGDGNTFTAKDVQGIKPPPPPPLPAEFKFAFSDVETLFQVADLGGRSRDGALKKDELEKFITSNNKKKNLTSLAKVLLNNFDSLKQVIDKPASPFSPSGEFISLDNLRTVAGRDGNATVFSSADLKPILPPPPPPNKQFKFLTEDVLTVLNLADQSINGLDRPSENGVFGLPFITRDGQVTLQELETLSKNPNISQQQRVIAQALFDNFGEITNRIAAITGVRKLIGAITPDEIQSLAAADGNGKVFSSVDLSVEITPPNPGFEEFPTETVLKVLNAADSNKMGGVTQGELKAFLSSQNVSKTDIRIAEFLLRNFDNLKAPAQPIRLNDAAPNSILPAESITASRIQEIASRDGNPNNLTLKEIVQKPQPPVNKTFKFETQTVLNVVRSFLNDSKSNNVEREQLQQYLNVDKPASNSAEYQIVQALLNNYDILTAYRSGVAPPPGVVPKRALNESLIMEVAASDGINANFTSDDIQRYQQSGFMIP